MHLHWIKLSKRAQELLQQKPLPCRMICRAGKGFSKVLRSSDKVFSFSCMSSQLVLEVAINVCPLLGLKHSHHLPAVLSSGQLRSFDSERMHRGKSNKALR